MEGLPRHPLPGRGPAARGGSALRRLVLLRHGRTAHNVDGRIQGQLDVPLDSVGRAQAEALISVFALSAPAVVISSDLSRARDTAQALCSHTRLPLALDERLRETFFGVWQGLTGPEVAAEWPREYAAWRAGKGDPVGGETREAVGARAAAVVTALPREGDALLVTHGGTARALVGMLLEWPSSDWWRLAALGNTCWSTLVQGEYGWRLERHNTGLGPLLGPPGGAV